MSRDNSFISIQNVEKYFGSFKAIDNVSMDVGHGEFFSLLGASGCGKTTLLRMLAGFENPSAGEIYIDGQPMSEVSPHMRPVNMVFQNYAIFPHLNVRDNIAYGLRKQKLGKAKRDDMVDQMLDLIKLPGYGDRKANELSGGQRQRIALARALILKPKVLLLDEPLGALDKQLREQMQLELRALQRTVGITFVFVTHDQEEALTLSDRVAVMSRGEVLQLDTPSGLYERPQNREVASFIGTMNFFEGRVTDAQGDAILVDTAGLGALEVPRLQGGFNTGDAVHIAMRPEKLDLTDTAPQEGAKTARGVLQNAAYLGERSHYYVKLEGHDTPVAVSAQNRFDGTFTVEEGKSVWLTWRDESAVLLRADS